MSFIQDVCNVIGSGVVTSLTFSKGAGNTNAGILEVGDRIYTNPDKTGFLSNITFGILESGTKYEVVTDGSSYVTSKNVCIDVTPSVSITPATSNTPAATPPASPVPPASPPASPVPPASPPASPTPLGVTPTPTPTISVSPSPVASATPTPTPTISTSRPPLTNCYNYNLFSDGGATVTFVYTDCTTGNLMNPTVLNGGSMPICAREQNEGDIGMNPNSGTVVKGSACGTF